MLEESISSNMLSADVMEGNLVYQNSFNFHQSSFYGINHSRIKMENTDTIQQQYKMFSGIPQYCKMVN